MNENIKKLSKDAYNHAVSTGMKEGQAAFMKEYTEKLSELIVMECAEICIANKHYNKYSVASDWAILGADAFKTHFGIENK